MMPENSQLLALAKLGGLLHPPEVLGACYPIQGMSNVGVFLGGICQRSLPLYLTSRDAIIPLVLKQPEYIQVQIFSSFAKKFKHPTADRYISELFVGWLHLTPSQIAEALLRAVGEWEEE